MKQKLLKTFNSRIAPIIIPQGVTVSIEERRVAFYESFTGNFIGSIEEYIRTYDFEWLSVFENSYTIAYLLITTSPKCVQPFLDTLTKVCTLSDQEHTIICIAVHEHESLTLELAVSLGFEYAAYDKASKMTILVYKLSFFLRQFEQYQKVLAINNMHQLLCMYTQKTYEHLKDLFPAFTFTIVAEKYIQVTINPSIVTANITICVEGKNEYLIGSKRGNYAMLLDILKRKEAAYKELIQ